jgi:hypothetical protein
VCEVILPPLEQRCVWPVVVEVDNLCGGSIMWWIVDWLLTLLGFSSPEFAKNFWPNFWSSLLVGIVITWIISKIVGFRNKAELICQAKFVTDRNIIIQIKNVGNKGFMPNEINYAVLIPKEAILDHSDINGIPMNVNGEPYMNIGKHNDFPIFPYTTGIIVSLDIPFEVDELVIYYYLSTVHGFFPKKATPNKNGLMDFSKKVGRFTINVATKEISTRN